MNASLFCCETPVTTLPPFESKTFAEQSIQTFTITSCQMAASS